MKTETPRKYKTGEVEKRADVYVHRYSPGSLRTDIKAYFSDVTHYPRKKKSYDKEISHRLDSISVEITGFSKSYEQGYIHVPSVLELRIIEAVTKIVEEEAEKWRNTPVSQPQSE